LRRHWDDADGEFKSRFDITHDKRTAMKRRDDEYMGGPRSGGYTRLYGKGGKRVGVTANTTAFDKYKYTDSDREKEIERRRTINDMKRETKKQYSPHQGIIDNIANKYREKKDEQARKLEQNPNKLVSIAGTLRRQACGNITDYKDDKTTLQYMHRKLNDQSPSVQSAYAVDRAVTKSANKIKDIGKKIIDKKLSNNRSAKSEDTALVVSDDGELIFKIPD
jgi:hypothetical protein